MTEMPALNSLISVRFPQATAITGLPRQRLYDLVAAGELAIIKIGKSSYLPVADLRAVMERHTRRAEKPPAAGSHADAPPAKG